MPLNICKMKDLFSGRTLIQLINIIFAKFEILDAAVAIIDLGTNTFHLLIADIYPDRLHTIHKEKQSVKIGEGGISRGEITEEAQNRALNTLKHFATTMTRLGVQQSHASATSAFRNASNSSSLVREIFDQTSIKINIIDGQQEAKLIYLG